MLTIAELFVAWPQTFSTISSHFVHISRRENDLSHGTCAGGSWERFLPRLEKATLPHAFLSLKVMWKCDIWSFCIHFETMKNKRIIELQLEVI